MRGIRTRLALTLVALVAVTVTAIGIGTYGFVESRLRDGLLAEASRQAQFNLSVLIPESLPTGLTRDSYGTSGLADAFRLRGDVETIVDYRDGGPPDTSKLNLLSLPDELSPALKADVAAGRLAFSWQRVAGVPSLIIGGRAPGSDPDVYFVFPAGTVDAALDQLRLGLLAAGALAVLLALAAAGVIARGILRPVDSGSAAAARIAAGDLSARVPAGGADEFGRFAAEFNRMADSLAATVARLERSERQNRRFVADVAHELRTPLTALVAEASIIEGALQDLGPGTRRAAELLVADVRRLRVLVDDLMELSRFDARAEEADLVPLDLAAAVRSIVASRLPAAEVHAPGEPVVVDADVRRLDRIVGNLLDNARIHAVDAPVEVSVSTDGAHATVAVADRGPGVSEEAIEHIFDRFFKADASRHGGTSGLGLAIAAEHAELLGGSLSAANRDGGGLAVTLRLPVTRSLPAGEGPDTKEREAEDGSSAASAPTDSARPNA